MNASNLWRNSISVGRASLSVGGLYIHQLSVEQYIIAVAKLTCTAIQYAFEL